MSAEVELANLEAAVFKAASIGSYLRAVETLRKLLADKDPSIKKIVLQIVAPQVEGVALAAVSDAFGAGRDDALGLVEDARAVARRTRKSVPPEDARKAVLGLDAAGALAVRQARLLARGDAPLDAVLAPLFGHANSIQGRVTEAVNRGGNAGVLRVASVARLPVVWVAETDACVHCLAYSGQVAEPGQKFPGGLTYGRKSYHPDALPTPPLHPNCRCTLEPLNDISYAEGLRREADRSVLRGFSLESESMSARVDAAQRLLERGVDAPKSVKAFAERAVREGKFPTRNR